MLHKNAELSFLVIKLIAASESVDYIPCVYFDVLPSQQGFCPRSCPAYGSRDCTPFMLFDIASKLDTINFSLEEGE